MIGLEKKKHVKKDNSVSDILGDKSAYGEFVSTFHAWTGLEGTHKRGAELQEKGKIKPKQDRPYAAKTKEE